MTTALDTTKPRTLARAAHDSKLTILQIMFVALRKCGWSQADAYRLTHPHVTPESASPLGNDWNGKLKNHITQMSLIEALPLLSDARLTRMLAEAPDDIALRAAAHLDRLSGRLADPGMNVHIDARRADVFEAFKPSESD